MKSISVARCNGQEPVFMDSVFKIVTDCPVEYGGWDTDGKSFTITNADEFAKTMFPSVFHHCKWSSFTRQLNYYGFKRLKSRQPKFMHPLFVKEKPELLSGATGKKAKSSNNDSGVAALAREVSELKELTYVLDTSVYNLTKDMSSSYLPMGYDSNYVVSSELIVDSTNVSNDYDMSEDVDNSMELLLEDKEFWDSVPDDATVIDSLAGSHSPIGINDFSNNLSDASLSGDASSSEDDINSIDLIEDEAWLESPVNGRLPPLPLVEMEVIEAKSAPLLPENFSVESMVQAMKMLDTAQQHQLVDWLANGFARQMASSYKWNNGQLVQSAEAVNSVEEVEAVSSPVHMAEKVNKNAHMAESTISERLFSLAGRKQPTTVAVLPVDDLASQLLSCHFGSPLSRHRSDHTYDKSMNIYMRDRCQSAHVAHERDMNLLNAGDLSICAL